MCWLQKNLKMCGGTVSKDRCQKTCITGADVQLQCVEGCLKLRLCWYHIRNVLELNALDAAKWLQLVSAFWQGKWNEQLDVVNFTGEVWFHSDEYIKSEWRDLVMCKSTSVAWKILNIHKKLLQDVLFPRCLVGPIYFQTAVDSELYRDMITVNFGVWKRENTIVGFSKMVLRAVLLAR